MIDKWAVLCNLRNSSHHFLSGILLCSSILAGTGCVSFPRTDLKFDKYPLDATPLPPVYVTLQYSVNGNNQSFGYTDHKLSQIVLLMRESGQFIAVNDSAENSVFTINMKYELSFSLFWEYMQSLSCLSLGIIPTAIRDYVTLSASVDRHDGETRHYKYDGHIQYLNWIFIIAIKEPAISTRVLLNVMINNLINDIRSDSALIFEGEGDIGEE